MNEIKKEQQIEMLIEMPATVGASKLLINYDTEALEEAYQYLYAKQEKGTLQRAIWHEIKARREIQLKNKRRNAGWIKKFEKEWEEIRMLIRRKAGADKDSHILEQHGTGYE